MLLGYDGFRQYVEERLGLHARAVGAARRAREALWDSPALQEARRRGVSYEKLRVLARMPETDIASWIPRALEATCIALKREVEGEHERQMRARKKMLVPLPRRVAVLLAAAIEAVRGRFGRARSTGTCLAVIAFHFLASWSGAERRSKTRSQKVRDRGSGLVPGPGCSHPPSTRTTLTSARTAAATTPRTRSACAPSITCGASTAVSLPCSDGRRTGSRGCWAGRLEGTAGLERRPAG